MSEKVLVIDDSRTVLNLVAGYLGKLRLQTLTAFDADEGLALARAHKPALVLCDIVMPGRDGYAFLADLRADPELSPTLVALMTGVEGMQNRMQVVDAGADDLLTKPFDEAELVARVKALLRLSARESEARQANAKLRERVFLLTTLFVAGNQMRDSLDPTSIYGVIRDTLETIAGAQAFTIYVREKDAPSFHLTLQHGLNTRRAGPPVLELATLPEPLASATANGRPFFHPGPPDTAPTLFGLPLLASVPLPEHQTAIGLINVHAFSPGHGDSLDSELLTLLSGQVAAALHTLRLQTQLKEYAARLQDTHPGPEHSGDTLEQLMFHQHTLMLFSAQIHGASDLDELLASIRDLLVNFVGVARYRLVYLDQGEQHITTGHADGIAPLPEPTDGSALVAQVMSSGKPILNIGPGLAAAVPLLLDDRPQGVLIVESLLAHKTDLDQADLELLSLLAREAAIALFTAYARERQAARRRDFHAMLAHDLRAPLGNQKLALETLEEMSVSLDSAEANRETQTELVSIARASNAHLAGLVDDFLAYSQIEAGGIQLYLTHTDVLELVRETAKEMLPSIKKRGQKLSLSLPDAPVEADVDAHHLKRVLANLLSNAIKYTGAGGHIHIALHRKDGEIAVHVQDDGLGIPPDDLPRLFARYYRVRDERSSAKGTGLGLLIVKEIVQAHGGRVWVESEGVRGKGSTFSFTLPVPAQNVETVSVVRDAQRR